MSAPLALYDLQNDPLEVKKVNSAVNSYVSDIKIVEMESPCGFTPISVPMTVWVLHWYNMTSKMTPWRSKRAVVTSGVKFSKKKIENGFTMGVYPYLDTHDDVCVLLI